MKKNQIFALTLSLIFGMSSLFAADPVKPTDPVKPEMWKAPEQSYIWIKYKCNTDPSNPQDVYLVSGYLSPTVGSPRPCYKPTNWQGSSGPLNTSKISCPNINIFQECLNFGSYICAVRYLSSEVEGAPAGQTENKRPKSGVTIAGHDIVYCGGTIPNPPCTYPLSPECTNLSPWNTNP